MKFVRKNQARSFKNGDKCIAYEYFIGDKDINGAVMEIDGRHPDKGCVVNRVCKEIGYIISGKGYIVVGDKRVDFVEGDLIFIEPCEKYYWFGDKLKMFMPCSPAFYQEQHSEVG